MLPVPASYTRRFPFASNRSPEGTLNPLAKVPIKAPVLPSCSVTNPVPRSTTKRLPLGPKRASKGLLKPETKSPTTAPVVLSTWMTEPVPALATYKSPTAPLGPAKTVPAHSSAIPHAVNPPANCLPPIMCNFNIT